MQYKIQVSYKTGDSNSSRDEESCLEMEWSDLSVVKTALQRIKEHYLWYDDQRSWHRLKTVLEPEWHKDIKYDFCIKLPLDNGAEVQFSAFWCGYFEALHSAKIVIHDDEMEISF